MVPGGLLLVVSQLFAVPVSVVWVGLEKKVKNYNLDVRNIFLQGHILSTTGDVLTTTLCSLLKIFFWGLRIEDGSESLCPPILGV